jgi:sRNA-binding regulator protein Hfq
LYEGASVNLIKWQGSIFLNRINESMKDNSLFQVNGTQASVMVKEFLKYAHINSNQMNILVLF